MATGRSDGRDVHPEGAHPGAGGVGAVAAGAVGIAVRLGAAWIEGAEATLRFPARATRLVVRLDELVTIALEVGAEVGPPLRRLLPVLDELAAVLAEGAPLLRSLVPALRAATPALDELAALTADGGPLLRRLLPVLESATPALEQLGAMGGDLVEVIGEATPGLRRMVPLLDAIEPEQLAELVAAANDLLPAAVRVAGALPPNLIERLLGLVEMIESELPALRVVGDTRAGLAAVSANTEHLVAMLDDLYAQLRGIPGTGALLRRGRRQRPGVPGGAEVPGDVTPPGTAT